MPLVTLPNGIVVEAAPNDKEAALLYEEIFEADVYLRHGLEIEDGECVFDVGANVGLFAASLVLRRRDLRLVLFEPLPDTFAMLERNAERLLGDADVTLVQAGVSAWPGSATFEFDPNWTTLAGAGPFLRASEALGRSSRRRVGLVAWNRAAVDYGRRIGVIPTSTARRLNAALGNPVLAPLTCAAMWARFAGAKANALRRRQRIECELTTISAAMRDHGVERVDLLKIDAEGAEWAVLQGIEASDWPRIRQFAIEVHDVEGRVDRIRALLEHKGYEVVVEHSDWELLELLGLRMVYARR